MPNHAIPAKAMFERLVAIDTDDCVLWPYSLTTNGYGRFQTGGRGSPFGLTHRLALARRVGDPPTSRHYACHECDNKACMNYRHLRWDTPAANQADRHRDGTACCGEQHPNAKLTDAQVVELRSLHAAGETPTALAARYGIHRMTACGIAHGRKRNGVPFEVAS